MYEIIIVIRQNPIVHKIVESGIRTIDANESMILQSVKCYFWTNSSYELCTDYLGCTYIDWCILWRKYLARLSKDSIIFIRDRFSIFFILKDASEQTGYYSS